MFFRFYNAQKAAPTQSNIKVEAIDDVNIGMEFDMWFDCIDAEVVRNTSRTELNTKVVLDEVGNQLRRCWHFFVWRTKGEPTLELSKM